MPKGNNIEDFVDIKAGNILRRSDSFRIGEHSIKKFYRRVVELGLEKFPQFDQYGKMTFFIPVDSAFNVGFELIIPCVLRPLVQDLRVGTVDAEVVKAHIVPSVLLFTKPEPRRTDSHNTLQFNTSRDSSGLKVMAKLDLRSNSEFIIMLGQYSN